MNLLKLIKRKEKKKNSEQSAFLILEEEQEKQQKRKISREISKLKKSNYNLQQRGDIPIYPNHLPDENWEIKSQPTKETKFIW